MAQTKESDEQRYRKAAGERRLSREFLSWLTKGNVHPRVAQQNQAEEEIFTAAADGDVPASFTAEAIIADRERFFKIVDVYSSLMGQIDDLKSVGETIDVNKLLEDGKKWFKEEMGREPDETEVSDILEVINSHLSSSD